MQTSSRPVKQAIALITTFAILTIIAAFYANRMEINPTPYILDRDHPSRVAEASIKRLFSNTGEQVFVAIVPDGADIFSPQVLNGITDLGNQIEAINFIEESDLERINEFALDAALQDMVNTAKSSQLLQPYLIEKIYDYITNQNLTSTLYGAKPLDYLSDLMVRAAPIKKVRSLSTVDYLSTVDNELLVDSFVPATIETESQALAVKQKVASDVISQGSLIDNTKTITSLQIELNIPEYDSKNIARLRARLQGIFDTSDLPVNFHVSGAMAVANEIGQSMERDNMLLTPLVLVIIALILFACFRTITGVVLPLVVATLSVIWTMAIMSAFGIHQNVVTSALPIFLITISVSDAIHLLSHYYHSSHKSIKLVLADLIAPMVITSVTTCAGFIALTSGGIRFVSEFGIFVTLGVIFAMIITLTLIPAIMLFLPTKEIYRYPKAFDYLIDGLSNLYRTISKHQATAIVCVLLITIVSVFFAKDIRVDNENVNSFAADSQLHIDDDLINDHFSGTVSVSIWLRATDGHTLLEPEILRSVEKIQSRILEENNINYTLSFVDLFKNLNQHLHMDGRYALPDDLSKEMASQYLLLYQSSSGNAMSDVLAEDNLNGRIIVIGFGDSSAEWTSILEYIETEVETILPDYVEFEVSGYGKLLAANISEIINVQINSLIISLIIITVVLTLLFKSIIIGVIATLPIVLTLIVNVGAMSIRGISIDLGTSLICSIALGIGIDYSIHFIHAAKRQYLNYHDIDQALIGAINETGRPILFNTCALSFGFMVLIASGYKPMVNLGIYISSTFFLSAIASLTILPLLLKLTRNPRIFSREEDQNSDL